MEDRTRIHYLAEDRAKLRDRLEHAEELLKRVALLLNTAELREEIISLLANIESDEKDRTKRKL